MERPPEQEPAKVGDVRECAFWLGGKETPEVIAQYHHDVVEVFARTERHEMIRFGPIDSYELALGDERVPPCPPHILQAAESRDDVKLLVHEATVVEVNVLVRESLLTNELEPEDLERLRAITRARAGNLKMSNEEADKIINEVGPRTALNLLGGQMQ
jgi:predicted RecB family endonuclease